MNKEMDRFDFKYMTAAWAGFTVLLVLAAMLVFAFDTSGKVFITLSNALNLLLLSCFLFFRRTITRLISNLMDESSALQVAVEYSHETKIGRAFIFGLVVSSIFIVYTALSDVGQFRSLIKEDGPVEYLSALFWFLSAATLAVYALKTAGEQTGKRHLLIHALFIVFFIVCGGEEISWGQRLSGHGTPEWLETVNVQDETNLHNIGSISVYSNAFFLMTLVFFLLLPHLAKRSAQIRNSLYYIGFPIPNRFATYVFAGSLLVWIFLGARFGTLGFHPFSIFHQKYYTQMDDEIFELLAAYSFLCFSILHSMRTVSMSQPIARPVV